MLKWSTICDTFVSPFQEHNSHHYYYPHVLIYMLCCLGSIYIWHQYQTHTFTININLHQSLNTKQAYSLPILQYQANVTLQFIFFFSFLLNLSSWNLQTFQQIWPAIISKLSHIYKYIYKSKYVIKQGLTFRISSA